MRTDDIAPLEGIIILDFCTRLNDTNDTIEKLRRGKEAEMKLKRGEFKGFYTILCEKG